MPAPSFSPNVSPSTPFSSSRCCWLSPRSFSTRRTPSRRWRAAPPASWAEFRLEWRAAAPPTTIASRIRRCWSPWLRCAFRCPSASCSSSPTYSTSRRWRRAFDRRPRVNGSPRREPPPPASNFNWTPVQSTTSTDLYWPLLTSRLCRHPVGHDRTSLRLSVHILYTLYTATILIQ